MKKLIMSAFLVGFVFVAQAQTNLAGTAAASRAVLSMSATEMTRQMYNDLQLNEGQYIKLKSLNQERIDRYKEIDRMYANDPEMRTAKIQEVEGQLDTQFAEVLTPKQFTTYLEKQGRVSNAENMSVTPAGGGASSIQTATSTNMSTGLTSETTSTGTSVNGASSLETQIPATTVDEPKTKEKGNKAKYKQGDMEQKKKPGEEKIKEGDRKVKQEADKLKVEDGNDKFKLQEDKVKMESASGELKIKNDVEKLKTDSVFYKSTPNETKIVTPAGKTKIEGNKIKTKTSTTKKKVKNQ